MTQKILSFCLLALFCLALPAMALQIPFNESIAGDRNLGQNFTWTVKNVSGWSDVIYHYTVYDYRVLGDDYTYYSPAWGQWFESHAASGKQYLAVWVRGWLEGVSWYGYDQERFTVWIGNVTVTPEPVHFQDLSIGKLGSERKIPVVIRELENRTSSCCRCSLLTTERYGWKDEKEYTRMEAGRSNAFDGYILYQIPVRTRAEDIRIAGWFGYWGTPVWYLTNHTINQSSIERQQLTERQLMESQRATGLRTSDRLKGQGVRG